MKPQMVWVIGSLMKRVSMTAPPCVQMKYPHETVSAALSLGPDQYHVLSAVSSLNSMYSSVIHNIRQALEGLAPARLQD